MPFRFEVPKLGDRPGDFRTLFRVCELLRERKDVELDFSRCSFLGPPAVALLGGTIRIIERLNGGSVRLLDSTLRPKVRANLEQNGFLGAFAQGMGPWRGNSIPFREDSTLEPAGIVAYLQKLWLGRGWVHISDPLARQIVGRMTEIFVNAFEHANSPVGVFSCGQHFPNVSLLTLTVVDFGIGIPRNVRFFLGSQLKSDECLKWAFAPGNSTRAGEMGRGIGLDLLKEFTRLNGGSMQVFSYDGYAQINEEGETFLVRSSTFGGTVVYIQLRCDEKYYRLASEADVVF